MSRYKVVLGQLGQGYRVEIDGADGVRQTVLGFSSENEANQWIEVEKQRERHQASMRYLDAAE